MKQRNLVKCLLINALAIPLTLCASQSQAAHVGVDIHLGIPAPVVVAPREVSRRPVPTFYFNETPEFIYSPFLTFSVGIGAPYDLFYDNSNYYICYQGYWYRSRQLNGPWDFVYYRSLPPAFRRYKIDRIRKYRDKEYDLYRYHRPSHPEQHYSPRHERDGRDYREERRPHEDERHNR
jgi:hypothetical protein